MLWGIKLATLTRKVEPQIYCSDALRNEDEGYDDNGGTLDDSHGAGERTIRANANQPFQRGSHEEKVWPAEQ